MTLREPTVLGGKTTADDSRQRGTQEGFDFYSPEVPCGFFFLYFKFFLREKKNKQAEMDVSLGPRGLCVAAGEAGMWQIPGSGSPWSKGYSRAWMDKSLLEGLCLGPMEEGAWRADKVKQWRTTLGKARKSKSRRQKASV